MRATEMLVRVLLVSTNCMSGQLFLTPKDDLHWN